jgi:PiT family inorganic phosphate transporter
MRISRWCRHILAAIAWNLGTWYFGIPCSSSHTMIGALLGGGFAFFSIHGGIGPNWDKAKDIGLSLPDPSPFWFLLAIGLMFLLRALVKKQTIFKSPDDTKKGTSDVDSRLFLSLHVRW